METNPDLSAAFIQLSMLLTTPRTVCLIALLLVAACTDYNSRRIPNKLIVLGIFLGLSINTLFPAPNLSASNSFLSALSGLICGLGLLLPFYLLRVMGAGDVKLMAMCGAFLGIPQILWAALAIFIAGGILALVYLTWTGKFKRTLKNIFALFRGVLYGALGGIRPSFEISTANSAGNLPYGVAIASGTIGYLMMAQLGFIQ